MFAKFDAPVIYASNSNLIEDANANFNTLVNTIIANNSNNILASNGTNNGFCTNAAMHSMSSLNHSKKYANNAVDHLVESSHSLAFNTALNSLNNKSDEEMGDENGTDQNEVNSLNLDFDDVNSKSDIDEYYANACSSQTNTNNPATNDNNAGSKNAVTVMNSGMKSDLMMNASCNQNASDGNHVSNCINSGADLLATTNISCSNNNNNNNNSSSNIQNHNHNINNNSNSNLVFHANENENNYYTHIRSTLVPSTTNMLLNVGNRLMMGNANAAMNLIDTVAASSSSSSPSSSSLSSPSSSSSSNNTISKESCAILKSIANSANMNGNISNKHDQQANAIFSNQTNDLALFIRNTHCVKEKIRRDRIKASCIHLRRLLPNVNGIKTDMATLLETTVVWAQLINACVPEEYVKNIKSKLSEYATLRNSMCNGNGEPTLTKAALNSLRVDKISIPRLKSKMVSKSSSLSKQQQQQQHQQNLQQPTKSTLQPQAASCHQNGHTNLNASISSISSSSFDSASPNASISPISLPSISSFQSSHHHTQPNSSSTPNLIMSNQAQSLAHQGAHANSLNNIPMPINAAAAAAAAACMNMNMKPACQGWLSLSQQNKLTPSFHTMPLHLTNAHGASVSDKSLTLNEAFLLNHHQHQHQQLQQHHQQNLQLYNSMQMAASNEAAVSAGMVTDCPNSNFNQILNSHHQNMTNAKRIMSYLNNQSNQSQSYGK